jgi:hypothetical protein
MKIKTSVTERAMPKDNGFKIAKDAVDNYNEVCVRAYTTGAGVKSESVTMSFPRHRKDYPMNHPEVVAAIEKCRAQVTTTLQKHLDQKAKGALDTRKIKV